MVQEARSAMCSVPKILSHVDAGTWSAFGKHLAWPRAPCQVGAMLFAGLLNKEGLRTASGIAS
jgi:hypothetical protein